MDNSNYQICGVRDAFQYKILVIVTVIAIISTVVALLNAVSVRSLQNRLSQRDEVINSFLRSDSLAIREVTKEEPYFIVGNQEMNSEDFVDYVNHLLQRCYLELDSLSYYREYYNMTRLKIGATLELDPTDSTGCRYLYTYPSAGIGRNTVDSLVKESQRYRAIIKKYPIIVEDGEGYFVIKSPQIDSALLLLPYFRKNLKALSNDKWVVTYY